VYSKKHFPAKYYLEKSQKNPDQQKVTRQNIMPHENHTVHKNITIIGKS